MQDQYVADVGDFGKYGLLRALTLGLADCVDGRPSGYGDSNRVVRLGVIWYYIATGGQLPPLGLAFDYLGQRTPLQMRTRECDEGLFAILAGLVNGNRRSVADVEQSGALPDGTVYFRDDVNAEPRAEWFARAMNAMHGCDVVFVDPDNGLADAPDAEHATYGEAAGIYGTGKSLVIYQSFGRAGAEVEIQQHSARLREELGINGPPGEIVALWYHRRIARVFFVIPNPANPEIAQLLRDRVGTFMRSCWGTGRDPHFTRVDC